MRTSIYKQSLRKKVLLRCKYYVLFSHLIISNCNLNHLRIDCKYNIYINFFVTHSKFKYLRLIKSPIWPAFNIIIIIIYSFFFTSNSKLKIWNEWEKYEHNIVNTFKQNLRLHLNRLGNYFWQITQINKKHKTNFSRLTSQQKPFIYRGPG